MPSCKWKLVLPFKNRSSSEEVHSKWHIGFFLSFSFFYWFDYILLNVQLTVTQTLRTIQVKIQTFGILVFPLFSILSPGHIPPSAHAEDHHQADVLRSDQVAGYWGLVQWHQPTDHEEAAEYRFYHRLRSFPWIKNIGENGKIHLNRWCKCLISKL